MDAVPDKKLLSRPEVEQQYGISRRFLERAAGSNDGPPVVRVGRLCRYRPADIETWIESRCQHGGKGHA